MTDMNDRNDLHAPLDTNSDAYRLRGWLMPLCGILTSLLFCLLVPAWYTACVGKFYPIAVLFFGVLISAAAIPFHILGSSRTVLGPRWLKSLFFCVSIAINTLSTSLSMTAYYVHIAAKPTTSALFAGVLISMVLCAIMALLMQRWPHRYALLTGIIALLSVALIIVSIVFWVRSDSKLFFSFAFFNLLWTLISIIALHVACSDEGSPCLRFASFASFGILVGVAAIVLVILACAGGDCDCDCGDGCCDCGNCGGDCGDSPKDPIAKKHRKRS